jgi:hypothetical protein
MRAPPILLLAVLAAAVPAMAQAQAAPARAASAAAPQVRVIEDDGVRIEETVVSGQLQRVVVQSKLGSVRPYEIVVPRGGRDPSQDKGATGQRVWSVLKF